MPNDRPSTDAGQRGGSWSSSAEPEDGFAGVGYAGEPEYGYEPAEEPEYEPDYGPETDYRGGYVAEPVFGEHQEYRFEAQPRARFERVRRHAASIAAAEHDDGERGFRAWLRRVLSMYGWRVYAVPVLAVITVLVIVNAVVPGGQDEDQSEQTAEQPSGPVVREVPATANNLNVPTAELPDGGPVTQQGNGSWHIVPGKGPVVGKSGKLYRYTVEVEDGIDPAQYGGDEAFAKMAEQTLNNPKSWSGTGQVRVQRVDDQHADPDFKLSLTTPGTDHRKEYCDYQIKYETSCYRSSADRVIINLARWVRGAKAFSGDMFTYRQYAINHEVGHAFGNGHVGCPNPGALAPVMMQQTFGVSNDYVAQLNEPDASNRDAVPADHKTCVPNAWPNPQAR